MSQPIVPVSLGGFDALATLQWLDGVVDIYMPDLTFADERIERELAGADKVMPLDRRITVGEHHVALKASEEAGLERLD